MEQQPRPPQPKSLTPDEINAKVKEKIDMLLVPGEGETLNAESYALIGRRIMNQASEGQLTSAELDSILSSPEGQDMIIAATVARLETDTQQPGAYVYDSNGHVIRRVENRAQMGDTTREEREAA